MAGTSRLGRQWTDRISLWIEALKKLEYVEIGRASFEASFPGKEVECLENNTEAPLNFAPIKPGTPWGKKWEYGWFRTLIQLPPDLHVRLIEKGLLSHEKDAARVVCFPDAGGEMLVWINDEIAGSRDKKHDYLTLNRSAMDGESFSILLESYAGHGPRLENGGPYPPEEVPVPEPSNTQVKVEVCSYGLWIEEAYQLRMDAEVLWDTYQLLDESSLRAMQIARGLKKFTEIADVELPWRERRASFVEARKILAPLLQAKNGSTAPVLSLCGQSHLDLEWLWPWEETKRKCARTYANQLVLAEEYPEYRFLACEPKIMDTLEEYYPQVFLRVKEAVVDGKFIPEGGMYIEADTNLPCGEGLIRQLVRGKRWFREKFSVDSKLLWLPDTFGFSGALPQLMKLCKMEYFATQKLLRADPECQGFPYQDFIWEGNDGSKVLGHMYKKNNAQLNASQVYERWYQDRPGKEYVEELLFPFGYGDGGGGATRDMLETSVRIRDLEGLPRTKMESPMDFFERRNIEVKQGKELPVYRGELYLAWHRGTYTSQTELKYWNRKAENALREAELWTQVVKNMNAGAFGTEIIELDTLWDSLLFQEFHDILPGTSIARVNEEARTALHKITARATGLAGQAKRRLLEQQIRLEESNAIIAFNSLSWPVEAVIEDTKQRLYHVSVPACGYCMLPTDEMVTEVSDEGKHVCCVYEEEGLWYLENDMLVATLNNDGCVTSLSGKETGREYIVKMGNVFHLYKDVNSCYDAWEMGRMVYENEIPLSGTTTITILEEEGVRASLLMKKQLGNSTVTQRIWVEEGQPWLGFDTEYDWQERHKLWKVEFASNVYSKTGIYETQYGYAKRTHGTNEPYQLDQYEVCQHRYAAMADADHGIAILNDGRYGISARDNSFFLSLQRAPLIPDMSAEQGKHHIRYAYMVWDGSITESKVVQKAWEWNTPVTVVKPITEVKSVTEEDPQVKVASFLQVHSSHVLLDWVTHSERGNGVILRLYQSMELEEQVRINISFPFTEAWETNLLEEKVSRITLEGNELVLEFAPFEVKTIMLQ